MADVWAVRDEYRSQTAAILVYENTKTRDHEEKLLLALETRESYARWCRSATRTVGVGSHADQPADAVSWCRTENAD